MSEEWVNVASTADLAEGNMMGVTIGDKEIAIFNIGGVYSATSNLCTHAYAFLTDGWLDGENVECPLHAGIFEVKTGKGMGPPIGEDLKVYPVRVSGDAIEVNIAA